MMNDQWGPPPPTRYVCKKESQIVNPCTHSGKVSSGMCFFSLSIWISVTLYLSPLHFSQNEPPLYMRVIYDFVARNHQELSVMKGDVVQVGDSLSWVRS